MENSDDIFNKYKILLNNKGNLVNKGKIRFFDLPQVFFNLLDIIDFDYEEQTLHKELESLSREFKFEKFELNDAIEKIKEGIICNNSIQIMQYISKGDIMREKLFEYSKLILDDKMQKIEIDTSSFNENNLEKLKEMFVKVDKFIVDLIIEKIDFLDVKQNIRFLNEFTIFLKHKFSTKDFQKTKIFPNQEYSLCLSENLHKDGFKDENLKDIIFKVFSINLRKNLVLDCFSDIYTFEVLNFYNFSSTILECLSNEFLEKKSFDEKMDLFLIIFQYSTFENDQKQILSLLHFFFGLQITPKELKQEDCWMAGLTKQAINLAIDEIVRFISKFSNTNEIVSQKHFKEEELIEKLSTLYTFSIEGQIFPNQNGDLNYKNNIYIIYDNQVEKESLNVLFELFIKFQNSEKIKYSILKESIRIQDEKMKNFNIIDLNFLSSRIMKIIETNKMKGIECQDMLQKLFEFLDSDPKIRVAFSPLIEEKLENISLSMLNKITEMNGQYEENESEEIGYRGEALVYEDLIKSGKFSYVNWLSNSEIPTPTCITLNNGNAYYIKEHNQPFDIVAEDFEGNKFYFEVKSKASVDHKKKAGIQLSRNQIFFASKINYYQTL